MALPGMILYDTFRGELIRRTSDSQQKRLHQLLVDEELGNWLPSQLLRQMKQLMGENPLQSDILKQLFVNQLLANAQMILASAGESTPVDELAELADRIMEVTTTVAPVTQVQSSTNPFLLTPDSSELTELRALTQQQARQIQTLTDQLQSSLETNHDGTTINTLAVAALVVGIDLAVIFTTTNGVRAPVHIKSRPLHHRETRKPGCESDQQAWPCPKESHILHQRPYNRYSLPGGYRCRSQCHPHETGARKMHTNLDTATGRKPFPYPNIQREIPYFELGIPSYITVDFCCSEVTNPYFRSRFFAPLQPLSQCKTRTISRQHYKPLCGIAT